MEFEGRKDIENSDELIKRIWKPTDLFNKKKTIKEIESIKPKIVLVEDGEVKHFDNIRRLISTMEWKPNPGRLMRLYVVDEITDKILGIITLASDVSSHSERDKYIGWSQKVRMDDKRINYLANGTTIVPTQPFGFNFLGGKLVACMVSSPQTTFQWETKYKEKLAGITTTSLYGSFSQYTLSVLPLENLKSDSVITCRRAHPGAPDLHKFSFTNNIAEGLTGYYHQLDETKTTEKNTGFFIDFMCI